jgi:hypothetical protein
LMARTSRLVMKPVRIISLVAEKGLGLDLGCQRFRLGDVVSVAAGEAECQWVAKGVDNPPWHAIGEGISGVNDAPDANANARRFLYYPGRLSGGCLRLSCCNSLSA